MIPEVPSEPSGAFGALGILGSFVIIFLIIMLVLAFLLPLFVLRIRKEIILMNSKMSQMVMLLGGTEKKAGVDPSIKICPYCATKNRRDDYTCMACGKAI